MFTMARLITKSLFFFLTICSFHFDGYGQNRIAISGKVIEGTTKQPMQYATVHLTGSVGSTLTKADGSFHILLDNWYDTLQVTNIGYDVLHFPLQRGHTTNLVLEMHPSSASLDVVTISVAKKPGKSFMQKVIEHKKLNDPERFDA